MSIISSTPLLQEARKGKYGIAAFNIHSLDMIHAVVEGASELDSPVIIQTTVGTVKTVGPAHIVAVAKLAADQYNIPVALHLDHCTDFETIVQCARAGYTSVMIDASMYPFEENVNRTLEVMNIMKHLDINVEAELGRVGGVEDEIVVDENDAEKAVPSECVEFVNRTNVPTLAPAIGTAHGIYQGTPNIDFGRIEQIASLLDIPLVLHGGSAIPDEDVRKCIRLGMAKMNISTELKNAYSSAIREHFSQYPEQLNPRMFLKKAKDAAKEIVKAKILLVESNGKASHTP